MAMRGVRSQGRADEDEHLVGQAPAEANKARRLAAEEKLAEEEKFKELVALGLDTVEGMKKSQQCHWDGSPCGPFQIKLAEARKKAEARKWEEAEKKVEAMIKEGWRPGNLPRS